MRRKFRTNAGKKICVHLRNLRETKQRQEARSKRQEICVHLRNLRETNKTRIAHKNAQRQYTKSKYLCTVITNKHHY